MNSIFVSLFANSHVPTLLVYYILALPVVAAFVAFARQVIGVSMFGAYAPIITVYAFLGAGFLPGVLISILIFLSELIARLLTKNIRLHYMPRTSLLISLVAVIALILVILASYTSINIFSISAISFVLFIVIGDIYLTAQSQQGYKQATIQYIETIIIALIMFLILSWSGFEHLLLYYPEVIILAIIADVFIGRWKGLRLKEIYRFRSVIKEKSKDYA